MMEEVGEDREGKKRGEDGEEKSIYVHGAKITSLSIPSTAPSKISPVYPLTHQRSGRKWRGKKPVEGMNMAEVNVCVSLKGINPTLQFN